MAMGRKAEKQKELWIPTQELMEAPRHKFYEKLNELLAEIHFDERAEELCLPCYAQEEQRGRPSVPPGVYFRMHMIGYFEGIESERGLEWRCSDSLSLRQFLGLELTDRVPDHSSLSRTRHRYSLEIHQAVFGIMLDMVESKGLLHGRVMGIDSTYIKADASMKAIVRRDTKENYNEFLLRQARENGEENPTLEVARRIDKNRKGKKVSNLDWESPIDPDSRIIRMKNGTTNLAYKPEHVVDLETGAIVSVDVFRADRGDTSTLPDSLEHAVKNLTTHGYPITDHPLALVADKGYHKASMLRDLKANQIRTYFPEQKIRGTRRWTDKGGRKTAVAYYENKARVRRSKGKSYLRMRGEKLERTFAHVCETGGARRTYLRGLENVTKRYLIQAGSANLGLVMRSIFAHGTPRGWTDYGITEAMKYSIALISLILMPFIAVQIALKRT